MSEVLRIEETIKTPEIVIDPTQGQITIKGRSLPEDAIEFYKPIVDHIQRISSDNRSYVLRFSLEYMNTSSAAVIRSIMELFEDRKQRKALDYTIEWCFEEDDFEMEEAGRNYEQTIPGMSIEFIEVKSI